jgi:hypothetical protein
MFMTVCLLSVNCYNFFHSNASKGLRENYYVAMYMCVKLTLL